MLKNEPFVPLRQPNINHLIYICSAADEHRVTLKSSLTDNFLYCTIIERDVMLNNLRTLLSSLCFTLHRVSTALHRVSTACCTVLSTVVPAALCATFGLFSIYFVACAITKRDIDRELVFVLVGELKRVKPCLSTWLCFQMSLMSVHVVTMYCCVKTPSALIAVFCW